MKNKAEKLLASEQRSLQAREFARSLFAAEKKKFETLFPPRPKSPAPLPATEDPENIVFQPPAEKTADENKKELTQEQNSSFGRRRGKRDKKPRKNLQPSPIMDPSHDIAVPPQETPVESPVLSPDNSPDVNLDKLLEQLPPAEPQTIPPVEVESVPVPAPRIEKEEEKLHKDFDFEKMAIGDEFAFLAEDGSRIVIEKISDIETTVHFPDEEPQRLEEKRKEFQPIDDSEKQKSPEREQEEKRFDQPANLVELKNAVAIARKEFVKEDYKNTQSTKWLRRSFGEALKKLKHTDKKKNEKWGSDEDLSFLKDAYYQQLNTLQVAELEAIKQSGLSGPALKEAMVGVVRAYKLDEALNLYQDYTQVRAEKAGWGVKLVENVGKWYNVRDPRLKLAFAGVCWGIALPTGGASLWFKKVLAGAGTFVAADVLLESLEQKITKKVRQEAAEREVEEILSSPGESGEGFSEERMRQLEKNISQDIDLLDARLQRTKAKAHLRKWIAGFVAVGAGGGLWMYEHFTGISDVQEGPSSSVPEPETATPSPVESETSPVEAGPSSDAPSSSGSETFGESGLGAEVLKDYDVTQADAKRGLWGILEHRLPEDMPKPEKNRMVQSLVNAIQTKLDHMDPGALKAAGFPTGDANEIFRGTTLHLDGLLAPEEVQNIMESQAPSVPDTLSEFLQNHPTVSDTEALASDESSVDSTLSNETPSLATVADQQTAEVKFDQAYSLGRAYNLKEYKEFFKAHPASFKEYQETGGKYLRFIMQDNPETVRAFGNTSFSNLNITPESLASLTNDETDDSLKRLGLFVGEARKTFGVLGMPIPEEKVYEYVARVTMMGVEDAKHPTLRLPVSV